MVPPFSSLIVTVELPGVVISTFSCPPVCSMMAIRVPALPVNVQRSTALPGRLSGTSVAPFHRLPITTGQPVSPAVKATSTSVPTSGIRNAPKLSPAKATATRAQTSAWASGSIAGSCTCTRARCCGSSTDLTTPMCTPIRQKSACAKRPLASAPVIAGYPDKRIRRGIRCDSRSQDRTGARLHKRHTGWRTAG